MEDNDACSWDPGKGYKRNRFIGGLGYRCFSVYRFSSPMADSFVYRIYLRCKNKDRQGQWCLCLARCASNIWPDTPDSIINFQTDENHSCQLGAEFTTQADGTPDEAFPEKVIIQTSVATQSDDIPPRVVYRDPPQPDVDLDLLIDTLERFLCNSKNSPAHCDQIYKIIAYLESENELISGFAPTSSHRSAKKTVVSPSNQVSSAVLGQESYLRTCGGVHERKTYKVGKDSYVYYEYITNGSVTSRTLGAFITQPLPRSCRLNDEQVGQLLVALDAVPFPSDPIWTPADGFPGSKYQVTDFLSRTDPRVNPLRDLVLKHICLPLHDLLDRKYTTLPLLECTLFGQEVGEADSTLPRYDNSFKPEMRRISAVFTLSGAGSFEFSIGRQVTSVDLDNEVLCLYPGSTLYRTSNTSGDSDPWIWGLVHLSYDTPDLSFDEGEFPANGDPNIPESWRTKHFKGKRASIIKPRAKRRFARDDSPISSRKK